MKASLEEAAAAAARSLQLCSTLCDPRDGSHQSPLSLGFSRQEHWSGLPFPSPMHERKSKSYLSTNFHSSNILKINARALGNVSKSIQIINVGEGSLFSTPSPAFIACRLLDRSHSDWCEMIPHSGLDLHFSDNEWCWASFHVFVSHLYVFFGEMSI